MSGAFGGPEGWGEPPEVQRTSGTASLALAAGILSFVCLFGFGGLLAIVLGWIAYGEIERSGGRIGGKGLAGTGIGLGIANLVVSVVAVGVLVALAVRPDPPSAALAPPPRPVPTVAPPRVPLPSPAPSAPNGPEVAAADPPLPTLPPHVGKISIVEAADGEGALEAQLLDQLHESAKSGEQVVLWTVTSDCEPCAAVGRALADARMQRALAKVRLVRADAASFPVELRRLGVPIDNVPGFTLLDTHAHALDHIHGGEWDDDIPANIAPILDRFLRHSLSTRRHPWARPLREGETPL
ncbi:MAG TPA: DUF4190 domain-containing protein [Polyangiaceae bacterium]|nr:DUF4190 domain-containing protein [Polyangiaceae bacterium]